MTIDTTLPESDPLRFRKNLLPSYKSDSNCQLKIINNKIKGNPAQYDLGRLAAKKSAYSSVDLRKYEYLTGADLGHKPSLFEQAKFDYSPLANIFTKGLDKDDKKEGLFKRLKNIEDNNEKQLEAIRDQGEKQLDELKNIKTDSKSLKKINYFSQLSPGVK